MDRSSRFVACLSAGVATSILCMVGRFVLAQPRTVFRDAIYLSPLASMRWLPVGAVAFVLVWANAAKPRRGLLAASVAVLLASCLLWYAIQVQPLNGWLLPPATVK